MLSNKLFRGAVAALAVSFSSIAMAGPTYLGGHEPTRLVRHEVKPQTDAPYALTGNQSASNRPTRIHEIRVGSRIVAVLVLDK